MIKMKEILKEIPLFSEISEPHLKVIEKYFKLKNYGKDELILSKDDDLKTLFIVVKGYAASTLDIPGSMDKKLRDYLPGDFFGGSSLFGDMPASDTYYSREETVLLTLGDSELSEMIEKNSDIAVDFLSHLLGMTIQRFSKSSRFLADVLQWGENASRRIITDELTGVYNRAFLDDAMENFFQISQSNSKPLSLFMMDLDDFRVINDTHGHDMGNKIIIEFANIIKDIISRHGIIARYGGDEFAILLPEANREKAKKIAEELRNRVESHDFAGPEITEKFVVTTSIGISCLPETANDISSFKEKADSSLYLAKEQGKNRVAVAE
jgi:diguanylate cyclase (GGDEF)-like protein